MSKHAGNPRLSDQAITDQARACAEEIRRLARPGVVPAPLSITWAELDAVEPGCACGRALSQRTGRWDLISDHGCSLHFDPRSAHRLLGRALALLEIMAGEK